jgi:hypothetical protein
MPYELLLEHLPAGVAMETSSGIEGHSAKVAVCEFHFVGDGDLFLLRLEGWPTELLSKLPVKVNRATRAVIICA